ncbi:MAG: hypothetical protein ABIA04_01755 [Pseudomonadota bacterium]
MNRFTQIFIRLFFFWLLLCHVLLATENENQTIIEKTKEPASIKTKNVSVYFNYEGLSDYHLKKIKEYILRELPVANDYNFFEFKPSNEDYTFLPYVKNFSNVDKLISNAEKYDKNILFSKAISESQKALDLMQADSLYYDIRDRFIEASLINVKANMNLENNNDARLALESLFLFDAELKIDGKIFSPKQLKIYNMVREDMEAKLIKTLELSFDVNGASVVVDGISRGKTSAVDKLIINNLPQKKVSIAVYKDGYYAFRQMLALNENITNFDIKLRRISKDTFFTPTKERTIEENFKFSTMAAGREAFLIIKIVPDSEHNFLFTAQVFKTKTATFSDVVALRFEKSFKLLDSALREFVTKLKEEIL